MPKNINVGIILDGNGRWATSKNQPRTFGHKKGVDALKNLVNEIVKQKLNVKWLSVFAFSTENWSRPQPEVKYLIKLLSDSLSNELINKLQELNIKFVWTGFDDKLPKSLLTKIKTIQTKTSKNTGLILNVVFNYSGRKDIEYGLKHKKLISSNIPDIDLLIRTGNEKRISNFLLYQLAYSEIIFEKTMWPNYKISNLKSNIIEYNKRHRRFGKI